jgi:hypothetical protein
VPPVPPLSKALLATLLLLAGCSSAATPEPTQITASRTILTPDAPPPASTSARPARGTVPPAWLGTRPLPLRADGYGEIRPTPRALDPRRFTLPDTAEPLPGDGFASAIEPVPADVLARSTWEPGCPVTADELAYVRVTFRGFDDARHTGELLVNAAAADDLVEVFRTLYRADFPLEELRITTRAELDAAPTGDGNNSGAFVCRPSVGSSEFSQHAYGLAIDLDPFQNPYERGDLVIPELASTYLDRDRVRPGMITADGPVVRAFAAIGWQWGGAWNSLKDYQHFSANGR